MTTQLQRRVGPRYRVGHKDGLATVADWGRSIPVVIARCGLKTDAEMIARALNTPAVEALESLRAAWNEHMATCPQFAKLPSFEEIRAWMDAPNNTASGGDGRTDLTVYVCPMHGQVEPWGGDIYGPRCAECVNDADHVDDVPLLVPQRAVPEADDA